MDPLLLGLVVGIATVVMLFSGIPIAFGLCFISVIFLVIAEGFSILNVFAETFYAGLNCFVLLSIPMFILMGMAVANSPAGKDLYTGLDFFQEPYKFTVTIIINTILFILLLFYIF